MPMQPGDVEQTWADTSALFKDYKYKPTTKIDKGIKEFVRWYKGYFGISLQAYLLTSLL